jgi:hypothetical protein
LKTNIREEVDECFGNTSVVVSQYIFCCLQVTTKLKERKRKEGEGRSRKEQEREGKRRKGKGDIPSREEEKHDLLSTSFQPRVDQTRVSLQKF